MLLNENSQIIKDYKMWLYKAKPGDKYIYFTGFALAENIKGTLVRNEVYKDARKGLVYLTRRKVNHETFEYIATKASMTFNKHLVPRY